MGEESVSSAAKKPCRGLVQQRLSRYWTALDPQPRPISSNAHPFRFMDLPLTIRQESYRLVLSFQPGRFTSLNYVPPSAVTTVNWMINHRRLSPPEDSQELEAEIYDDYSPEFKPIHSLYLVSKTIRNEIRAIIFSESVIAVSSLRYGGLRILEEAGPVAWRELRTLVIHIGSCRCLCQVCLVRGWPAREDDDLWEDEDRFFTSFDSTSRGSHNKRLESVNRNDRHTLSQWQRICEAIAAHGQPDRLELFLACDARDLELAQRIVRPLYSLPRLRNLVLSFGRPPKAFDKLHALAKDTCLDLLHIPRDIEPFRFFDLPTELQTKILEYTPLAHVHSIKMNLDGPVVIDTTSSWRFCCTRQHPPGGESIQPNTMNWPRRDSTRSIFCKYQSAAFNMACQCYRFSSAWFGVSRQFREVAQDVFYAHTSFEVYGWKEFWITPLFPSSNADQDRSAPHCFRNFLRRLGPSTVRRMKKLDIIFPPIETTYLTPEHRSWSMWLETLEILYTEADLPRLELTVTIARHIYPPDEEGDDWGKFARVTEQEELEMLEAYKQIFRPMKRLYGLKNLFIHLPWPFRKGMENVRRANERMIEQSVMGELYDSTKYGKPPKTFWSQPGFIDWWAAY
ncbi:hypothetical protein NM208_g9374 [Fusarium decemcellulare]|uniref:Uncharacterized protein n=1 Tax=Fusarium decemcellulare TaxID=57161 RepID=A0ACC1S1U4_9HYPO|nr:hypothetical protein NM208_g9374 [Fusarium decemcellulare]